MVMYLFLVVIVISMRIYRFVFEIMDFWFGSFVSLILSIINWYRIYVLFISSKV